ncbi:nucleoside triphosphate pyrophosphohydrolase [Streptomyces sp. NPDC091278]|uniref:nucleoside triphosphate pyrophosphohydrolase n=1 Tax=Streptomyces sp. NPDC091278 TaxID=3155301 RepID=UPI00344FA654
MARPPEHQEQHPTASTFTREGGGKLVRDKIPAIIREAGEDPVTYTAGPAEYPDLLMAKLYEELHELACADASGRAEEAADLAEALYAYALDVLGIDQRTLDELREAKRRARGGFSARIVWLGNR